MVVQGIPIIPIKTTKDRSVGNLGTPLSIDGNSSTRITLALRMNMANAATTSYNLDPTWYAFSAATDHITSDLDKLTMKENYDGQDQVHTANGTGMMIQHIIGQSMVSTPSRHILLNNVLHVSHATHNLPSVHRLTSDNDVFLELYLNFFS
jgi:hypothetical protein